MSQTAESENPLAAIIDFEKQSDAEVRGELREQFIQAVIDVANGKDVADAGDFLQWGLSAEAFSELEVRTLVGKAREVLRLQALAAEADERQRIATEAEQAHQRIVEENRQRLREAAENRIRTSNDYQAAFQAGQQLQTIRNQYAELFDESGQLRRPSK